MKRLCALLLLAACGGAEMTGPPEDLAPLPPDGGAPPDGSAPAPDLMPPPDPVPEVQCAGAPMVGPKEAWRHGVASPAIVLLGSPRHRGLDLVVASDEAEQVLRGEISYAAVDKALPDELVELYGCVGDAASASWRRLGATLTDQDGAFALTLRGADRLAPGQRDVYVSVLGDRSGTSMLALVAPRGSALGVSDIDGTLTETENSFPEQLVTGKEPLAHDQAPQLWSALRERRYHPVFLTSRGRIFTAETRRWLLARGFPRGPLRLAPQLLTFPGDTTVAYKVEQLKGLQQAGMKIEWAGGNRKSDIQAYQQSGLPADRIFVKRPEYDSETQGYFDSNAARGFVEYRELFPVVAGLPQRP